MGLSFFVTTREFKSFFEKKSLVVVFVFFFVYLVTRSPIYFGDGFQWISVASSGDPTKSGFGDIGHFLQVPLVFLLSKILDVFEVSPDLIFLSVNLISTLLTAYLLGYFVFLLLSETEARKEDLLFVREITTFFFATALLAVLQWNGEIFSLPQTFLLISVVFFLKDKRTISLVFWVLSVLSHSEFALVAPVFFAIEFREEISKIRIKGFFHLLWQKRAKKIYSFYTISAISTVVGLLFLGAVFKKWNSPSSLYAWVHQGYLERAQYINKGFSPIKAVKGLFTAFCSGGNFIGDVFSFRAQYSEPMYVFALFVSIVLFILTVFLIYKSYEKKGIVWIFIFWLTPLQIFFNWRLLPQVPKYHAGSLPAFICLVSIGAYTLLIDKNFKKFAKPLLYGFCILLFSLNFIGSVLPIASYSQSMLSSVNSIKGIISDSPNNPLFICCDDEFVLTQSGADYLKAKTFLVQYPRASLSEIRDLIKQKVLLEAIHRPVYLLGDSCRAFHWQYEVPRAQPLDNETMYFSFEFLHSIAIWKEPEVKQIPLNYVNQANPFSWRYSDLYPLHIPDGI
ncbi:MAG: hypothetical protein AB7F43_02205 [Bacteriovoracia bacterium]